MARIIAEFKPIGDWAAVRKAIHDIPKDLESSSLWGQRKAGEKLVRIAKSHLHNQDLSWAPLTKATVKRKGNKKILIDTYAYYTAIETWQENKRRYIGVKNHKVNAKGENIAKIARIHEYLSYSGGPYRALWGPSLGDLGGPVGVRDIIIKVIYNKLEKLRLRGIEVKWQR